MATFSEIKAKMDEIARANHNCANDLRRALVIIAATCTTLGGMPTKYAGFVSEVDQEAVANPGNEAFSVAQAEKDELVADFQALRIQAEDARTALEAIITI